MVEQKKVYDDLLARGARFFNAIHPNVYVDLTADLGIGILLASHCSVMPNAKVGNNCIICAACSIDHDVVIGDNVYISPGVNLAGGCQIGAGTFIGTNAAVLPKVRVGNNCVIGAGAVVKDDVSDGIRVAGIPAKQI